VRPTLAADGTKSPLAWRQTAAFADGCLSNPTPFPWSGIHCLGLQSYSRQLYLSRGNYNRLYP
jgi:hypothetical protein